MTFLDKFGVILEVCFEGQTIDDVCIFLYIYIFYVCVGKLLESDSQSSSQDWWQGFFILCSHKKTIENLTKYQVLIIICENFILLKISFECCYEL